MRSLAAALRKVRPMRARAGLVVASLVLAGCGGDDGGGSGLADALGDVAATGSFRGEIAWSDLAAIREAGGFEAGELEGEGFDRWLRAYGIGLGPFFAA